MKKVEMTLEKFIELLSEQFDDTDLSLFNADTRFKNLEDYTSLVALLIITMIDEEYGVIVSGDEMGKISTVSELFNLIVSKK